MSKKNRFYKFTALGPQMLAYLNANFDMLASQIDGAMLRQRAITADKVLAGGIITESIADGAVTTPKLASQAVTSSKLATDAVTAAKIADDAVRTEHIKDGEVQQTDLNLTSVLSSNVTVSLALSPIVVTLESGLSLLDGRMYFVKLSMNADDPAQYTYRIGCVGDGIGTSTYSSFIALEHIGGTTGITSVNVKVWKLN